MSFSGSMSDVVTIPKKKYAELLRKARKLDSLVDSEGLSGSELARIESAKKTPLLSEEEFGSRSG
ncbi:MAG: hypothetical protein AABW99_04350 [archaeon]